MLNIIDVLFTILHLVIVGFNLFGWIWPATRKAHLAVVLLTAGSWFILGIWFGIGYCPITDWQWQVKESLGEQNLPSSFIKYIGDKITGINIPESFVNYLTLCSFALAALLSLYFNFLHKKPVATNDFEIH